MIFDKIKSIKDYAHYWSEVEAYITQRDYPFGDNSKEATERRKTAAQKSIWGMARIYFPDYVLSSPASFHSRWERISRITNEPILIEAFRGAGKSTFFTFLDPVHAFLFDRARYMIISSYTQDRSAIFSGRILAELKYNQLIKADFGEIIDKHVDHAAAGHFEGEVPGSRIRKTVQALSIGQNARGLVAASRRPDYARLDDIQNRKLAQNRKNVDEIIRWITLDLIPAMAAGYDMKIIGTAVNNRDAVADLKRGSGTRQPVSSYRFVAISSKGKSKWPEMFPLDRLEKLKKTIGSKGILTGISLTPIRQ